VVGIFLSGTAFRLALESTQPRIKWVWDSKATGAWSWPHNSIQCRAQECVELWLRSPLHLLGVVLI